ncbi:integrating conjugative element protein [Vreelandella olivaria]|uniref:integrating conjugative element protein n=1 Tax=Vreelandella olivaria TaxID=390919 RepID=UPI00201FB0FE|nr:integrating conjugative element protein [Halomonas olivaria]
MKRVTRSTRRLMPWAKALIGALGVAAIGMPVMAQTSPITTGVPEADDVAAEMMPALTVVADHGGEPARPYYVAIGMAGVAESEGYVADTSQTISGMDILPVESEALTPGTVETRALELPPGTTPFFLVGDDDLSISWLEQRGDSLRSIYAVGLVVNVQDAQGMQRLRDAAPGLELRPVSGDDLAGRIGLVHYPVLITPTRLEQ